jgi:hypothetical protein
MKSRKNNLGKRFGIFHGHPSIQGQKEIKEKKQFMPRFETGITWASIHPGTNEIKEKNNLCKGLLHSSCMHPSIHPRTKGNQERTIYAKV